MPDITWVGHCELKLIVVVAIQVSLHKARHACMSRRRSPSLAVPYTKAKVSEGKKRRRAEDDDDEDEEDDSEKLL